MFESGNVNLLDKVKLLSDGSLFYLVSCLFQFI